MSLDVTFGNISLEEAERLAGGKRDDHEPGSSEPWISNLVGDFVVANGCRVVLETGSFMGRTSRVIADALASIGGGQFVVLEVDPERALATKRRLEAYPTVAVNVLLGDALQNLRRLPDWSIDLAFVDDNHEKPHVRKELMALWPKMNRGGLILLHDVFGSCDLQSVVQEFGGYSLDLPRMGPAGGLGIIQCR